MGEQFWQTPETVEDAARMGVTFDAETIEREGGRNVDRKKTPYIRKEDLPPRESCIQWSMDIVSPDGGSEIPEIPRDMPRWNLRAERKLTGFVRKDSIEDTVDDLVDELESEAESNVEDSPQSWRRLCE